MSEQDQAAVGQILRDARIAQGITLEDAAVRLRLMQRQIEAMETEDFVSLGQPVFARGFVRNYARLLGLAPEPLLARMKGAPEEPAPVSQAEPPPSRSWLTSPWLFLLLLGVLLLVALPVALYLWLNSDVDEGSGSHAPVVEQSRPAAVTSTPISPAVEQAVVPVAPAAPAAPKLRRPICPKPARPSHRRIRSPAACCILNLAVNPGPKSKTPAGACCIAGSTLLAAAWISAAILRLIW